MILRLLILVDISSTMLLVTGKVAGQDKGKGQTENPHGWSKGEKKGWTSDVPPGIEKKDGWLPPGLSQEEQAEWKDGRPPGWSRGEKQGWKGGDMPPGPTKKGGAFPPGLAKSTPLGWEKWNDEKKEGWEKEIAEVKENVRAMAKKLKDFSEEDLESALGSIEAGARKGAPVTHVRSLVEKAMEKGIGGRGIETASRAMAYGVGKEVDFDHLGKFIDKKMDEGLRDDELAIEIYKEIASRHEERLKAKDTIQDKKKTEVKKE